MRAATLLVGLALLAGAAVAEPAGIVGATYAEPSAVYAHGALGGGGEWAALVLQLRDGRSVTLRVSPGHVFEDIAPHLADLTGDGAPEVIAVQSNLLRGSRLVVYGVVGAGFGLIAATPPIGQRHRWLSMLGAADLDADGRVEIALIDRPHLARILTVLRLEEGALRVIATAPGLTNHAFGAPATLGGLRDCAPEIITLDAGFTQIIGTDLVEGALVSTDLGRYSPAAMRAVLDCAP